MVGPLLDAQLGQILTVQGQFALLRGDKTADRLGKGGFSRAVGAHNGQHFALMNGQVDVFQHPVALVIGKVHPFGPEQHRHFGGRLGGGLTVEPVPHLLFLPLRQGQFGQKGGMHIGGQRHPGIFESGDIQRLPDAALLQDGRAQKPVGSVVKGDAALVHDHHPIHLAVEHVLQPVLDDDHGAAGALLDLINELDGLLSGGGVQVGQRLVKQQHVHLSHHDAGQADPLFLSARNLVGGVFEHPFHTYQSGGLGHLFVHLVGRDTVVLQRKGNVLGHRQADELAVGVLQHGAHDLAQAKQAQGLGLLSGHRQLSGHGPLIGGGDQTVDTVGQGGFSAARRTGDEHFLSPADV